MPTARPSAENDFNVYAEKMLTEMGDDHAPVAPVSADRGKGQPWCAGPMSPSTPGWRLFSGRWECRMPEVIRHSGPGGALPGLVGNQCNLCDSEP